MKMLPVALPKIISKTKKCFPLLVTPLGHFHNHIMKIIYTITPNDLQKNKRENHDQLIHDHTLKLVASMKRHRSVKYL